MRSYNPFSVKSSLVKAARPSRRPSKARSTTRPLWTSRSSARTLTLYLFSRLALRGEDWGENREVEERQKALMRLTKLSRTAVADGLRLLVARGVISVALGRYSWRVAIPDVDELKQVAFASAREVIERDWASDAL